MTSDVTTIDATITDLRSLLSELDPAAPAAIPDRVLAATAVPAHQVMARAAEDRSPARLALLRPAHPGPAHPLLRRRTVRWGAAALALTAAGSIAAVNLRHDAPAAPTGMVRCFSVSHQTDNPHQYTDTSMAGTATSPAPDPSATATSAVGACSGLWQIGLIQPGAIVPDAASSPSTHPVPDLVACVLDGGQAAVFPGDAQTCHALGLPQLTNRS